MISRTTPNTSVPLRPRSAGGGRQAGGGGGGAGSEDGVGGVGGVVVGGVVVGGVVVGGVVVGGVMFVLVVGSSTAHAPRSGSSASILVVSADNGLPSKPLSRWFRPSGTSS